MDVEECNRTSAQDMAVRFDLLAIDAKEYALFLVGPEGHLLWWNPGAERLFGYQSDEIIGQHFSRFFIPEDIRNGQPEHELKTAQAAGRADCVCWQVRKDTTNFLCRTTVTPLLDENKQIGSFARVMHDLTDSQKQQAQVKRADALAEANRSKEEFLALLSHELRNPLSPILNALNILRQVRTGNPIIEQAGGIIERQVGQMVRLVDDLLDISRITKGKLRLQMEPVDLRIAANRAAESVRPVIEARKHEFSLLMPTEALWVEADPARLEQIIVNLLTNAAKYTDAGGSLGLSVSREGSDAVIRVQDNGVGIASEMLTRIFGLFTQADGSLTRSHGGLGIGLALASTLVEMHGGRIQASSPGLGKGSQFTVKLPLLAEAPRPATNTYLEPGTQTGRSLRVMVVEDNVDSADSLGLLLRLFGHEVQVARNGTMALEMAAAFRPSVVLLDIGLPGMDGFQVAQRLRLVPDLKGVTLCAMSGYTPSDADLQQHPESGFDRYFVKPVTLDKLTDLFKTVGRPKP